MVTKSTVNVALHSSGDEDDVFSIGKKLFYALIEHGDGRAIIGDRKRQEGANLESADIAKKATEAALDKQAVDILMLDIRQVSSFADYFVVCSADSERQINAICDEIDQVLSKNGVHLYRREGDADSGWVILDFSRVIVHVFAQPQREYYDLEHLWSKATPVVRIL